MIVFWIVAALLSAAAAAAIMAGAASGARVDTQAMSPDPGLALHRRQLAEVEDLAERGLLAGPEVETLRAEAARRLLSAADETETAPSATPRDRLAILIIAALTALLALGVYLGVGAPGTPDQPFAKRVAAWRSGDPASLDPAQMAAVLNTIARNNPTDPAPLQAMAIAQMASDQVIAAQTTLRKAIALAPERAGLWASLGESFVAGAQGTVDIDAQRAFQEALKREPANRVANYYMGRAAFAAGDKATGLAHWRAVLDTLAADDPRRAGLEAEIAAAQAGTALNAGGPTQAQINAAQGAVGPEQIRAMVDGLAARLAADPNDAAGWVRLIRAYGVLGETAKRDEALRRASARFGDQPEIVAALKAAAR
jgi:cytochrome c-type biogenesis protein CcmH